MRALFLAALVMALGAAPAQAVYKDFQMPSGNIGCGFTDDPKPYLRCDILQSEDKPAQPRSCELDYGTAYSLNRRGRARALCVGDTVVNRDAPVLAYGKTKRMGGIKCTSRTSGLRCRNKSDHGFFLSRGRIDVF